MYFCLRHNDLAIPAHKMYFCLRHNDLAIPAHKMYFCLRHNDLAIPAHKMYFSFRHNDLAIPAHKMYFSFRHNDLEIPAHKMYFCFRHNDLAWNVRNFVHNQLQRFNFSADLRTVAPWATSSWSHTDLPRMQQGMLGAQVLYISVYLLKSHGMLGAQVLYISVYLLKTTGEVFHFVRRDTQNTRCVVSTGDNQKVMVHFLCPWFIFLLE